MTKMHKTRPLQAARPKGLRDPSRPFFARAQGREFAISAESDVAELRLYDEIGYWGITAKTFRAALDGISAKRINLLINSPGGDVFDGIAMYNDLLDHDAEVHVKITGLAASAASLIAMAGDQIEIASNAQLMIHNAWGLVVGNRHDMRDFAKVLDNIDGALTDTYTQRTGLERDEVAQLMDAETWLTSAAAVDKGFADETVGASEASARFDLSIFQHAPIGLSVREAAVPETTRDLEALLRDAGLSRSVAKSTANKVALQPSQREAGDQEISDALSRLASIIH